MLFLVTFAAPSLGTRPWMDTADPPSVRAAKLVKAMNLTEKLNLFHGSCGGYVGNVCANERLGIPAIKMNDGPQGFRDDRHPGSSTAWPCSLAIAATFDKASSLAWGKGMGGEFYRKGSNVQLGPGICLARVPRNGRNFEYISGEDPYLGYALAGPAVTGIQSMGVVANAKHWVDNNQETDRTSVDERVDERTQFEMYYYPFTGAIAADVGSFMCSYNKIRLPSQSEAKWSCENPLTLQRDLKDRLGFKGWVMSDWGATHSMSIMAGLDQEMPSASHMNNQAIAAAMDSGAVSADRVDDGALRILTPFFKVGAFDKINNNTQETNVTSAESVALTRKLAADSIVLLKNDEATLPLSAKTPIKLALIGKYAKDPVVHGGGSGSVAPSFVPTPFNSIRAKLGLSGAPPAPPANCTGLAPIKGFDYHNTVDQTQAAASSVEQCCDLCAKRTLPLCFFFTHKGGTCWMKGSDSNQIGDSDATSGSCRGPVPQAPDCDASGTTCVYYDDGSDITRAAQLAESVDAAIVFVATTSHEGGDRDSLSFDGNADELVISVASGAAKTIVAAVAPGHVLTPWRESVDAITLGFFPGQEYGNALTDVLFGDVNPSAKLPITMPKIENEMQFAPTMWPGIKNTSAPRVSVYSERLNVGYRWYHTHGVAPAYAFGHGLSYTTFSITNLTVSALTVSFEVSNAASGVVGSCVAQLYLTFPKSAEEPPKQLKRFWKAELKPAEKVTVEFALEDRDLSIWDVKSTSWSKISGTFGVAVGQSSDDPDAQVASLIVA